MLEVFRLVLSMSLTLFVFNFCRLPSISSTVKLSSMNGCHNLIMAMPYGYQLSSGYAQSGIKKETLGG